MISHRFHYGLAVRNDDIMVELKVKVRLCKISQPIILLKNFPF